MRNGSPQRLYLLSVYIASLKYYEKLLPRLREHYDVRFLIIRPNDERRRGMLSYCQAHDLLVEVIDAGLARGRVRIPFLSALIKRHAHQRALRKLFRAAPGAKLIGVKAISGFEPVYREANYRGIETIVLQSALTPPSNFYRQDARHARPDLLHRLYYRALAPLFFVADVLTNGWLYPLTSAHPKKVGVIGPEGVSIYQARFGFDPATITVVGNAEYQRVSELKTRVDTDHSYRDALLQKYALDPRKQRVLIFSVWFEHHGAVRPAHLYTSEETKRQVEHYRRMIEIVRDVCPEEAYEVLFKLHPAEKNIYESYGAYGVRFFGDEAISEELLVLSDLYIADPCTSANYMVVASGVPALFDNTEALPALNKCALFYPINRIVQSFDELAEAMRAFKEGRLDQGYDSGAIDRRSIDRIVEFIGT